MEWDHECENCHCHVDEPVAEVFCSEDCYYDFQEE